ncbi:hypothetical protein IT411_03080 [Candidatus Peregrinibacteria bacterium]|nr:hypothetical protein [Candidatus Peregrinibacteria bacterium]
MFLNRTQKGILVISALWLAGLIWLASPSVPTAKAQGLSNNSGSGQQLFCTRDFGNFLANGIDFDGEGFTDYWRDILVIYNSNYCQFTDIDSLLDRIDKSRKAIRQAFYVCDKATAATAAAQYYEMSAELYYLRHFVETSPTPNPKNTDEEKAQKVAPAGDIKAKFIQRFVNDAAYFDINKANELYEKFKSKYESKLESYRNCQDPNLEFLKQKIQDLAGTIETIQKLGQRFVERTQKRFSAMEKKIAANPGLLSAFSADSVGDFFGKVVDTQVNGVSPSEPTVWEQISNSAKENAPVVPSSSNKGVPPVITPEAIMGDITKIKARENSTITELTYVAEYDAKYRQIQDSGLDKMIVNLTELENIVTASFDPIDKIRVCTANIVGKQCGGR